MMQMDLFQLIIEDFQLGWLALVAFLFLYLTYYFSDRLPYFKSLYRRGHQNIQSQVRWIYLKRTLGFILLGIIPLLIILFSANSLSVYGLGVPSHPQIFWWVIIPTILLVGGSLLRNSKRVDMNYYPEVRQPSWSYRQIILNSFFWMIYLIGYEFGLRGFLFFSMVANYGLIPSVIINSVVYSLIHIFKGPKEAFGAFFLGLLFALVTYYTQSIWIACLIHVLMAIINDQKAIMIINQRSKINGLAKD